MVTYSTQRECAMVLWERVIYAIWKMLYLVRRATDAYDCTEWPLIIHNARRFRKYSRCRSLARERDSQSKKRRNRKTGFSSSLFPFISRREECAFPRWEKLRVGGSHFSLNAFFLYMHACLYATCIGTKWYVRSCATRILNTRPRWRIISRHL